MKIFPKLAIIIIVFTLSIVSSFSKENKINAIEKWYTNQGIDVSAFKKLPADEIAKRLNKAVFGFCKTGSRQTESLIDLFNECIGLCGEYAYVLRELLEYLGYQTRYINFYNIPQQGNHTAVEVKIDGKWSFLDPTFGNFFTKDGSVGSSIMSIKAVVLSKNLTGRNLFRTINREKQSFTNPLNELFDNKKKISEPLPNGNSYLIPTSYQKTEQVIPVGDSQVNKINILPLEIPLDMNFKNKISFGTLKKLNIEDYEKIWIDQTNSTINDDLLFNDISYVTSYFNYLYYQNLIILRITNIKRNQLYNISLNLYAKETGSKVQFTNIGKSAKHNAFDLIELSNIGPQIANIEFKSNSNYGLFLIRSHDSSNKNVRLFGIEIVKKKKKKINKLIFNFHYTHAH